MVDPEENSIDEHQNNRRPSHSHPPLPTRSHTGAGHIQFHRGKKKDGQLNAQRISKSLVRRRSGIVWFLVEF